MSAGELMIILIIISVVIALIISIVSNKINEKKMYTNTLQPGAQLPYHSKYILTKNEYYFYRNLKTTANKYGLQILTKIRLADLVEVNKGLSQREWATYFGKIKSKHVDFAIADDMKIVALIELDDNSHKRQDRIERDMFVDHVLRGCGYTVIHTYGNIEMIDQVLNSYRSAVYYNETTSK